MNEAMRLSDERDLDLDFLDHLGEVMYRTTTHNRFSGGRRGSDDDEMMPLLPAFRYRSQSFKYLSVQQGNKIIVHDIECRKTGHSQKFFTTLIRLHMKCKFNHFYI